ncbi:MAG: asparagine synthase (glutamine-hydrolyzing) [Bacteroidales bacterium]|nr:asparagine synthase (glutamine-hydrolyzing) [Bacteroidales bacterium]
MCGIIGVASQVPIINRDWIRDGCYAMNHRGPDDSGEWWSDDNRVGLAHRRLSIIDLSATGHQPMSDASGSLTIVFNGEIYNYMKIREELALKGMVFRSQSDTEVILGAYREWGTDCLSHFNGTFAFGLYDEERNTVFLARDRAGEKPLFYHHNKNILRFASELKGLMADPTLPRHIDSISFDCYLAMGYVPGERCILKGFNKLPPAHAMQFSLRSGEVKVWNYWKLPELNPFFQKTKVGESLLLDDLEKLLEDAVRFQLVADVPVGILLSGGLDSSLVTAMATRSSSKVKTFTICFPGNDKMDETYHARKIAKHFGTDHVEMDVQPMSAEILPRLAQQFDEPIVDSSMIPTFLISQIIRQNCKVALGGDGGDELFGGYFHHSRLLWMKNYLGRIPQPVRQAFSHAAMRFLPVGFKGLNWMKGVGTDLENGLPLIASYFDAPTRMRMVDWQTCLSISADTVIEELVPKNSDLLQRATRMDFSNYMAEDILVKLDRSSMLNSLEVRAPLLDFRLIEFAFCKVPSHLKATSHNKKILLKRLAARVLPKDFDCQRKQGFSIPLNDWLKVGEFRELFHDVLLDTSSIFDQRIVRSLIKGQNFGFNNGERLFALVLFELWRRAYCVSL